MDIYKKEKALFIYNPSSGKGKIVKNLEYITNKLKEKHENIEIIKSESKEHLISVIKESSKDYDYIYFSGGDGTFNMVLNAVPSENFERPIFGYIPGGSTNDMSYNLNISKNVKKGVIDVINSKPKKYNVGMIGDKRFIYVSDFGMFTDVSHITPADEKRRFGKLAYVYYAFKSFFSSIHRYKIIIDGIIYETPLIIISNSREVGSFKINPEKKQDDGMYYIVIVKNGALHGLFNIVHLFAFGLESAIKNKKVISISKPTFNIDSDNSKWDVDGEECTIEFPTLVGYSGKKIKVLTNRD